MEFKKIRFDSDLPCRLDIFLRQNVSTLFTAGTTETVTKIPSVQENSVSNSKIRRVIIAGAVRVNGRQCRIPSQILKKHDSVELAFDSEKFFYEKQNGDIDFVLTQDKILFEDEYIIIVNKPSHLPTEAAMVKDRKNLHSAIVDFMFARQKIENPRLLNPPYVGIMHRLDRDTSGAILFSKSRSVNAEIHRMFEEHDVKKTYTAISCVKNSLSVKNDEFSVEFFMNRISPKSKQAKWGRVEEKDGFFSKTDFRILKKFTLNGKNYAKIECRLHTGRTHQIRVHLSSLGLPLLGDELYGGDSFDRIMLHSTSLEFVHPVSRKSITVSAPLPESFLVV